MHDVRCRFALLDSHAAIAVAGTDAAAFLAAQLSQQIPSASAKRAALAAWHDAKGRVQGLFHVICRRAEFLLLTDSSLTSDLSAALHRYVLRADVSIAVSPLQIGALLGECAGDLGPSGRDLGPQAGELVDAADEIWLRKGAALALLIAPPDTLRGWADRLPAATPGEAEAAAIRLGLPAVGAAIRGSFLPQMLNLDLLGGIAYDKGCYPGQEIIARTQNLGTVKRRMLRYSMAEPDAAAPAAGSSLLDRSGQTVGTVVRAARDERAIELLAVTELESRDAALHCEQLPERTLQAETLPYPVPGLGPPRGVHG